MKKVLFLIILFLSLKAEARTYYVNTNEDIPSDDDHISGWHEGDCTEENSTEKTCSIREAVYWALQQNGFVTIYLKARGSYCLIHGAIEIVEEDPAEGEERNELDITIAGSGIGRKKIGGELEGCTAELIDNIFDVENGAKLTLKNIQIQGGANNEGGAIHVSNSNLSLKNVVIQSNRSGSLTSGGGGAIYVKAEGVTSTVTVDESIIKENSASYKGGGFYVEAANDGNIVFYTSNSTFSNNEVAYEGGAFFAQASTGGSIFLIVADSSISSNKTTKAETGYGGGGLSLNATDSNVDSYESTISAIISRSSIDANTSANSGGGIKISSEKENKDSVEVSLLNSTISGNIAENDGGGIYTKLDDVRERGDISISISNSTVVKNVANSGSGGGLKIAEFGWVEVFSSIIAKNSASSSDVNDCDIYKLVPGATAIFYSKGNNFIYKNTCSRRQSFDSTDTTDIDPSSDSTQFTLGDLADNGGSTQTHEVSGASVESKGSCTTLEVDQRGYYRDTTDCTVGSFETNPSGWCGDGEVQSDQGEECDGTPGCSSSCKEIEMTIDPVGGFGGLTGGFTGFGDSGGDDSASSSGSGSGSGNETGGGESSESSSGSSGETSGETESGSATSSGETTSSDTGGSGGGSSTTSGTDSGGEAEGDTGPEDDLNDEPSSGCSCRLVFDK